VKLKGKEERSRKSQNDQVFKSGLSAPYSLVKKKKYVFAVLVTVSPPRVLAT